MYTDSQRFSPLTGLSEHTMTDDWAHLHIKLNPQMKENWEEYVAEDEESEKRVQNLLDEK